MQANHMTKSDIHAVDLFCGAGGLTHGLYKRGIQVNLGVDTDLACKYPYEINNQAAFLQKPVEDLKVDDLKPYLSQAPYTLLAGCAPCQPFSIYNKKVNIEDKRWSLLSHFSRLIKELGPDLVTMENVPRLMHQEIYKDFLETLTTNKYKFNVKVINCAEYGLPQKRKRLVLIASKFGDIDFIHPDEFGGGSKNVKDAIGYLDAIKDGGEPCKSDMLHFSAPLSKLNKKRMKKSKAGGTWKDWPKELVSPCHTKDGGTGFTSPYSRMSWEKASPTITTYFTGFSNGRFGHPDEKQHRTISIREGAILQGFPEKYKFIRPGDTPSRASLARMIGNAVPVTLGEVIAASLINHIKQL